MIVPPNTDRLAALVARQVGRAPRTPWRVAASCVHDFPTVIASPSRLDDGTPFPTLYWLTCPYLADAASAAESAGELAEWDALVADDADLALALGAVDLELRERRVAESGGVDECGAVGVAGQESRTAAKCIHARIALVLVGIDDPIGEALLERVGPSCGDSRCASLDTPSTEGTP